MLKNYIDDDSFVNLDLNLHNSYNYIYQTPSTLTHLSLSTSLKVGTASIKDCPCVIIYFSSDTLPNYIGCLEGDLITHAFEWATQMHLPIVSIVSSMGMNYKEGISSLMQRVKISSAISNHSQEGLLYISLSIHYVIGGTGLGLISLADIIIAEEKCKFKFNPFTTYQRGIPISSDFLTSTQMQQNGFIDIIVSDSKSKDLLGTLLRLHA